MVNIFGSPNEMYQELLKNGHKIIDTPNVIISDDFAAVISSHWQNLLYERFLKYDLLDALVDQSWNKLSSDYRTNRLVVQNFFDYELVKKVKSFDKLKRARGIIDLLAFDTKWLRENREAELKTMKQSVYVDGEIKIKYGYQNNHAQKLIVVFQSNWAYEKEIHELENVVSHKLTSNLFRHSCYQFYQFAQRNPSYDFIFLEDDFNYIYGWFMTNYGKLIYKNLQAFITALSKSYEEVHFVGASKGGYGAYHIGKDMEEVKSMTLIAPILKIDKYMEKLNNTKMKQEIIGNNASLFEEILCRENVSPIKNDRIAISTGKSDYQYEQIIELVQKNPEINLTETKETYTHDEVIVMTHKQMLHQFLGLN
ncbi:hypothetical protein [Listeria ilorinensis]|uniref:hypothetical protein n=1 Tax=Listeria ilorinensis TaxID=2867439 RepID=UPI001EF71A36|nr:hypothetical protein [Listeria ilorinensis]